MAGTWRPNAYVSPIEPIRNIAITLPTQEQMPFDVLSGKVFQVTPGWVLVSCSLASGFLADAHGQTIPFAPKCDAPPRVPPTFVTDDNCQGELSIRLPGGATIAVFGDDWRRDQRDRMHVVPAFGRLVSERACPFTR